MVATVPHLLFEGEQYLIASDNETWMTWFPATCTVTGFGHKDWSVFYRPETTKKLTRVGLPLMFPNFSSVKNNLFVECGTTIPKHGILCRDLSDKKPSWKQCAKTANSVTMMIEHNDELLKQYPFKFRCEVTFEISPKKLTHRWKIINLEEDKTLPCSPGTHPYFAVPQASKKAVITEGGCDFKCDSVDWVDNCPDDNYDFNPPMTITIPNKGKLRISDPSGMYKRMQVWSDKPTAADHDFICFEPVRLGADGLNNESQRINVLPKNHTTLELQIELL